VEEFISFSALDNIHELTCVSLMGISIESVRCQLLSNSHSCKTTNDVLPHVLNSSPTSPKSRADGVEVEDRSEVLREEDVGTVNIKAIHFQLRRLLKDNSFSDNIVLTAIPEQKSKVMFTFENDVTKLFSPVSSRHGAKVRRSSSARSERSEGKLRRPSITRHVSHDEQGLREERSSHRLSGTEQNPFDAAPRPKLLRQRSKEKGEESHRSARHSEPDRHSVGFIMFECGIEDISISAVRRLGFKDRHPIFLIHENENISHNVKSTQKRTKADLENQRQGSSSPPKTSQPPRPPRPPSVKITLEGDPLGVAPSSPLVRSEGHQYSSSNSVHSWDSRISIPSGEGSLCDHEDLEGDASSGTLHLKTVWFNFAAPPPLPIKRKADFTK